MSRLKLWYQGQNQNLESSHMLIITLNFSCCWYYNHIIGKSKISTCIIEITAERTALGIWQSLWDKHMKIMGYRFHLLIKHKHCVNLLAKYIQFHWELLHPKNQKKVSKLTKSKLIFFSLSVFYTSSCMPDKNGVSEQWISISLALTERDCRISYTKLRKVKKNDKANFEDKQ